MVRKVHTRDCVDDMLAQNNPSIGLRERTAICQNSNCTRKETPATDAGDCSSNNQSFARRCDSTNERSVHVRRGS